MTQLDEVRPRGPWSLTLRLTAELENLRIVRWAVGEVGALCSIEPEAIYPIDLCAVEAVTNIIRHGYQLDASREFSFSVEVTPEFLTLRCEDTGSPIPDEKWTAAKSVKDTDDVNQVFEGGRGLFLMRELMDQVEYSAGEVNTLVLRKRLGA